MKHIIYLLVLICSITIYSCKFVEPTYGDPQNVQIGKLSSGKIDVSASININNPNSYGFRVKIKKMEVFVDDKKAADVKLNNKIKIKGNSDQNIDVKGSVIIAKGFSITGLALRTVLSGRPIKVKVKGKVRGKKFIFGKSIPIEYSQEVDPSQLQQM